MKKYLILFLSFLGLFALIGCKNENDTTTNNQTTLPITTTVEPTTTEQSKGDVINENYQELVYSLFQYKGQQISLELTETFTLSILGNDNVNHEYEYLVKSLFEFDNQNKNITLKFSPDKPSGELLSLFAPINPTEDGEEQASSIISQLLAAIFNSEDFDLSLTIHYSNKYVYVIFGNTYLDVINMFMGEESKLTSLNYKFLLKDFENLFGDVLPSLSDNPFFESLFGKNAADDLDLFEMMFKTFNRLPIGTIIRLIFNTLVTTGILENDYTLNIDSIIDLIKGIFDDDSDTIIAIPIEEGSAEFSLICNAESEMEEANYEEALNELFNFLVNNIEISTNASATKFSVYIDNLDLANCYMDEEETITLKEYLANELDTDILSNFEKAEVGAKLETIINNKVLSKVGVSNHLKLKFDSSINAPFKMVEANNSLVLNIKESVSTVVDYTSEFVTFTQEQLENFKNMILGLIESITGSIDEGDGEIIQE